MNISLSLGLQKLTIIWLAVKNLRNEVKLLTVILNFPFYLIDVSVKECSLHTDKFKYHVKDCWLLSKTV